MNPEQTILALLSLGSVAIAQATPGSGPIRLPSAPEVGYCKVAPPLHMRQVPGTSAPLASGPLDIVPQWDASVMAGNDEPYNITSASNRLSLRINGLIVTVTLTTGSARTAAQVAANLNANSVFNALADAKGWGGHHNYAPPEALYIRSKGVTMGSVEVLNTTNSSHTVLGLALGFRGPDADAARRVVFEQAFSDWEGMILDGGNIMSPYVARIGYSPARPLGGLASGSPIYGSGSTIVGAFMDFDSTENWFEDPTPGNDSEYESGTPPGGMDLLTIVRHELGHALGFIGNDGLADITTVLGSSLSASATTAIVSSTAGFFDTGSFTVDGERIPYTSKTATLFLGLTRGPGAASHLTGATVVCDNVYDSSRLNIAVYDQGAHTFTAHHPDDLMVPFFNFAERKSINLYPTVARISRGQGARIPLAVIDPVGSPTPDGRASFPWPNVTSAANGSASGIAFLLTDGTYLEPGLPLVITIAHELVIARDAFVLVR